MAIALASCTNLPLPKSSVKIITETSHGTAVFIDGGFLLTASHVINGKKDLKIKNEKGDEIGVTVLWESVEKDVALLKTKGKFRNQRSRLNCKGVKQGQEVFTIGNPANEEFIYSSGHIASAKEKKRGNKESLVSLDLTIIPGNSGGALYNKQNEVVGLVIAILPYSVNRISHQLTGFSYAVPSNVICNLMGK